MPTPTFTTLRLVVQALVLMLALLPLPSLAIRQGTVLYSLGRSQEFLKVAVSADGSTAYVNTVQNHLYAINLTATPANATLVVDYSSFGTNFYLPGLAVNAANTIAYTTIADDGLPLLAVNLSSRTASVLVSGSGHLLQGLRLNRANTLLYVVGDSDVSASQLWVVNISTKTMSTVHSFPNYACVDVVFSADETIAYLACTLGNSVAVLLVLTLTTPMTVKTLHTISGSYDGYQGFAVELNAESTIAYFGVYNLTKGSNDAGGDLRAIRTTTGEIEAAVSDPTIATYYGVARNPFNSNSVYVTGFEQGLIALNITLPSFLPPVSSSSSSSTGLYLGPPVLFPGSSDDVGTVALTADGSTAYIGTGDGYVYAVNLTTDTAVVVFNQSASYAGINGVALNANNTVAYITAEAIPYTGNRVLLAVNISAGTSTLIYNLSSRTNQLLGLALNTANTIAYVGSQGLLYSVNLTAHTASVVFCYANYVFFGVALSADNTIAYSSGYTYYTDRAPPVGSNVGLVVGVQLSAHPVGAVLYFSTTSYSLLGLALNAANTIAYVTAQSLAGQADLLAINLAAGTAAVVEVDSASYLYPAVAVSAANPNISYVAAYNEGLVAVSLTNISFAAAQLSTSPPSTPIMSCSPPVSTAAFTSVSSVSAMSSSSAFSSSIPMPSPPAASVVFAVPAGDHLTAIGLNANGSTAYIGTLKGSLYAVNLTTGTATLAFASSALQVTGVAINTATSIAYVTGPFSSSPSDIDGVLFAVNLNAQTGSLLYMSNTAAGPSAVALTADNSVAYLTQGSELLSVNTMTRAANIVFCDSQLQLNGVALSADNTIAYIAAVSSVSSGGVLLGVPLTAQPLAAAVLYYSTSSNVSFLALALNAANSIAYVAAQYSVGNGSALLAIDLTVGIATTVYANSTNSRYSGVGFNVAHNSTAYVAAYNDGLLAVRLTSINSSTAQPSSTTLGSPLASTCPPPQARTVYGGPSSDFLTAVGLSANGSTAYVGTLRGSLYAVSTGTGSATLVFSNSQYQVAGVAVSAASTTAYLVGAVASSYSGGALQAVNLQTQMAQTVYVSTSSTAPALTAVALTADSSVAYVTQGSALLSVNTVTHTASTVFCDSPLLFNGVALSADNTIAYIVAQPSSSGGVLLGVQLTAQPVVAVLYYSSSVNTFFFALALNAANTMVYVAAQYSANHGSALLAVDLSSGIAVTVYANSTSSRYSGVAVNAANNNTAYVAAFAQGLLAVSLSSISGSTTQLSSSPVGSLIASTCPPSSSTAPSSSAPASSSAVSSSAVSSSLVSSSPVSSSLPSSSVPSSSVPSSSVLSSSYPSSSAQSSSLPSSSPASSSAQSSSVPSSSLPSSSVQSSSLGSSSLPSSSVPSSSPLSSSLPSSSIPSSSVVSSSLVSSSVLSSSVVVSSSVVSSSAPPSSSSSSSSPGVLVTSPPARVYSDPYFLGFCAQSFYVHGKAGDVLSLLSDLYVHVSARLVFLSNITCPVVGAGLSTVHCSSHPGTYFGSLALTSSSGDRLRVTASQVMEGFSTVTLNGRPIEVGESVGLEGDHSPPHDTPHPPHPRTSVGVHRASYRSVYVHAGVYEMVLENSDYYLDLAQVQVSNWNTLILHVRPEGLLGRTWNETVDIPPHEHLYTEHTDQLTGCHYTHPHTHYCEMHQQAYQQRQAERERERERETQTETEREGQAHLQE